MDEGAQIIKVVIIGSDLLYFGRTCTFHVITFFAKQLLDKCCISVNNTHNIIFLHINFLINQVIQKNLTMILSESDVFQPHLCLNPCHAVNSTISVLFLAYYITVESL